MSLSKYENDFLSNLISIPSVGDEPSDGCPYGAESRRALGYFIDEAANQGFKTGIIDNKVGYVEFGSGTKMIGIVCHLDVVPAGSAWTCDPFKLTVKDNCFYGRGIIDDKGPACMSYFAMKDLKDNGFDPKCRIRLILGSDEERTCDCVETYALKGEIPDFAITPDAEYPVIFAEKGILHIKIHGEGNCEVNAKAGNAANMVPNEATLTCDGITVTGSGKTAHASRPELGINAIIDLISKADDQIISKSKIMSYIKHEIAGKSYQEYTGCNTDDISGTITANPAILNVNGETEELTIDIRYPISAEKADIIDFFAQRAAIYGLKVSEINHMSPLYKDPDNNEIRLLTEIWSNNMELFDGFKEEYRDEYASPLAIGGGTYARHLPNTIAFGIQIPWMEDQCHQADEHISINDFEVNKKVLTETVKALSALYSD